MKTNHIYNEDCLKTMAKMPENFIDLTVTSPPYDNMRDYKGYSFDFESVAKELYRVTKVGGVVVWVVGDQVIKGNETGTSFRQALFFKEVGFNLFDTMIFLKPNLGIVGGGKAYGQSFEYMFVFSKGGYPKTINYIKDHKNKWRMTNKKSTIRDKDGTLKSRTRKGTSSEYGKRNNVWYYDVGLYKTTKDPVYEHPAMFPEKLANDHIISWSMVNRRDFIGSEISQEYTELANERLSCSTQPLL